MSLQQNGNQNGLQKYNNNTQLGKFNNVLFSETMQNYIADVLGKKNNVASLCSLINSNTSLQKCEPSSVIFAWIKAEELDLQLNSSLGQAYIIPYGSQAQFQIGYKGFYQLAIRSNEYLKINVTDIREGEFVEHDPVKDIYTFQYADLEVRSGLPIIGYASYFLMKNGFEKTLF